MLEGPPIHVPKEHGAWAMLYGSFALGLLVAAQPAWSQLWLLVAATAFFFAHESVIRLRRAQRHGRDEPQLRTSLLLQIALLAAAAIVLVGFYRLFVLIPLGALAAIVLGLNLEKTARREERTVASEFLAILGFAMAAPAAYVATRGWDGMALFLWAGCLLFFGSSVFHVKASVLARVPQRKAQYAVMRRATLAYHVILAGVVVAFVLASVVHAWVLIAFAPVIARALWAWARPPAVLNLKRIGIFEIFYSLNFIVFTWLAFARGA